MDGRSQVKMNRWRWAAASKIGTAHIKLGTRKQDTLYCFLAKSDPPIACAIVSDGAGSARFGGEGAAIVCRTLSVSIREYFRQTDSMPDEPAFWSWVDNIRDRLSFAAKKRDVSRQAFASTLIVLIASEASCVVAHIGDGAVVARDKSGSWKTLSRPENGEYASTTYFVTQDSHPKMRLSLHEDSFDAFAVFTDGIECIALDAQTSDPFVGFFNPMLSPLDRSAAFGNDRTLSQKLGEYLLSAGICERTDDDKSLILISSA